MVTEKKIRRQSDYRSKSYTLKHEVVEAFADACAKLDVSQAGQLTKMMKDFIEEVNKKQRCS